MDSEKGDMIKKYDYLLVGVGLFNAVFAREATAMGKRCLVIDKRPHIGGNLRCEQLEGITVHKYGAHIFHTSNNKVWKYMNSLCSFNNYVNSPLAIYGDELYNLPFNMNTFHALWGVKTPDEARAYIDSQRVFNPAPANLEEKALMLIGPQIYEKLIKGYTEKQWGRDARALPAFIISRLPLRFTYDNNYFDDPYQGIPIGGYNQIFEKCFAECDLLLKYDFMDNCHLEKMAAHTIFTGMIDQYFDYSFGQLEYRSLRFETEVADTSNYQGNAVENYTERSVPYTRIIEHRHFEPGCAENSDKTVITREYPLPYTNFGEAYYPVNDTYNSLILGRYTSLASRYQNVTFAGRLGSYKYYNMDHIVDLALKLHYKMNG